MNILKCNQPLADNIFGIIKERGVKQSFVAEKAGFSISDFNSMLKGRRVIKACDIPLIATALGVTPNDLYGLTDQRNKAG